MLRLSYPKRVIERIKTGKDRVAKEVGLGVGYLQGIVKGKMKIPSNRTAMNFGLWPVYLDLATGEIVGMPIYTLSDVAESEEFRGLILEERVLGTLDMEEVYARLREHKE